MIKTNTVVFVVSLTVLAVCHYLSLHFYLYWIYPWLDIPMHGVGGSVVALGWYAARDFSDHLPERTLGLWSTLAVVLAVALAWEAYEVLIGISIDEPGYWSDTVADLLIGLLGGLVGYQVARRLREDL